MSQSLAGTLQGLRHAEHPLGGVNLNQLAVLKMCRPRYPNKCWSGRVVCNDQDGR
jgi:hypothetical protein